MTPTEAETKLLAACREAEQWADVDGFPGYRISSHGRVLGRSGSVLVPSLSKSGGAHRKTPAGYWSVRLVATNGRYTTAKVHRLVALAFVPGYAPGLDVNHKDLNKLNNHASNLEWITHERNMRHWRETGPWFSHPLAKMTPEGVSEVRRRVAAGESIASLARAFGINKTTCRYIVIRKTWDHVA
jgi:hypothetical protein